MPFCFSRDFEPIPSRNRRVPKTTSPVQRSPGAAGGGTEEGGASDRPEELKHQIRDSTGGMALAHEGEGKRDRAVDMPAARVRGAIREDCDEQAKGHRDGDHRCAVPLSRLRLVDVAGRGAAAKEDEE